jgi:hypothetical protein
MFASASSLVFEDQTLSLVNVCSSMSRSLRNVSLDRITTTNYGLRSVEFSDKFFNLESVVIKDSRLNLKAKCSAADRTSPIDRKSRSRQGERDLKVEETERNDNDLINASADKGKHEGIHSHLCGTLYPTSEAKRRKGPLVDRLILDHVERHVDMLLRQHPTSVLADSFCSFRYLYPPSIILSSAMARKEWFLKILCREHLPHREIKVTEDGKDISSGLLTLVRTDHRVLLLGQLG